MKHTVLTKFDTEPTEVDWGRIGIFRMRVEELRRTTVMQAEQPYTVSLTGDAAGNIKSTAVGLPEGDSLTALVVAFRHIWSNREPGHFPTVVNIVNRHCRGDDIDAHLDELRKCWKRSLFMGAIEMAVGSEPLTANTMLDLWINGHVLHTEAKPRRKLADLIVLFESDFARYLLIDAIVRCSHVAFALDDTLSGLVLPRESSPEP